MSYGKCSICKGRICYKGYTFNAKCEFCGEQEDAYIICENDHYLCMDCASKEVMDKLYAIITEIKYENPLDVAEAIIAKCGISGHTPHPITTASLLIGIKNTTGKITYEQVVEGVERSYEIPGGWCGYYGACGAAIAIGVSFSVMLNATPSDDNERSLANLATSAALAGVAQLGGPCCCIGSIRISLERGIELIKEHLDIVFPEKQKRFSRCWACELQPTCRKERCKYY